jgi:hypothetical protein
LKGEGSFDNPITFAGDKNVISPGKRIYLPSLSKYFIMEDECEECIHDWNDKKIYHFDLWIGPDSKFLIFFNFFFPNF